MRENIFPVFLCWKFTMHIQSTAYIKNKLKTTRKVESSVLLSKQMYYFYTFTKQFPPTIHKTNKKKTPIMHKKSLIYSLFPFHHQCNFLNRPTIVYFHLSSPKKYNLSRHRITTVWTVLRTLTGLNNILIDKQNSFQKQPCQWFSIQVISHKQDCFCSKKTKDILFLS